MHIKYKIWSTKEHYIQQNIVQTCVYNSKAWYDLLKGELSGCKRIKKTSHYLLVWFKMEFQFFLVQKNLL